MKVSTLLADHPAGPLTGVEPVVVVQDGETRGSSIAAVAAKTASLLPEAWKGDPGGTDYSIGLFINAPLLTIPLGVNLITISGTLLVGDAGAGQLFIYDAGIDALYVIAHPTTSFIDAGGRGFRRIDNLDALALRQGLGGAGGDALIMTGDGRLASERFAEQSIFNNSQTQMQYFWARVEADTFDVDLLYCGDSTSDANNEKAYRGALALAGMRAEKTIVYRLWDDAAGTWGVEQILSVGTGARTIRFDNFSVPGSSGYRIEGARQAKVIDGSRRYAAVILNYDHNLGTTVYEEDIRPSIIGQISVFQRLFPHSGILITLQNPRVDAGGAPIAQTPNVMAAALNAAMLTGVGVIDEYNAFKNDPAFGIAPGQPGSLYLDDGTGTHHSIPEGVDVGLAAFLRAIEKPPTYVRATPLQPSAFLVKRRNFAPNPVFADWLSGAAAPGRWTFSGCTAAKDPGRIDDVPYSLNVTNGAAANPVMSADVSNFLSRLRGRYVTMQVRVWRPSTTDSLAGRCSIVASDGVTIPTPGATSAPRLPGESVDGWHTAITTFFVPWTTTSLVLQIATGASDGSDVGRSINIGHVALFEGVLPGQVDPSDSPTPVIDELYADANVGLPSGYDGAFTAVNGTITLTGSTIPSGGRLYINLPALVPGQLYTASWTPVSDNPGNGGTVIVRNGFNGIGAIVNNTLGAGSVTWSSNTVSFIAPVGPCCLLLAGNTATTGFVQSTWSVAARSSGFQAFPIPLAAARNGNGTVLDAAGGAGLFKIAATPGTFLRLQGEDADNATKTDTVYFELVLPKEYIAGRPVTITVHVGLTGPGTAGTKTLEVSAWLMATAGTAGADIGPASQAIAAAGGNLAFVLNGATLTPGARLWVELKTVVQETTAPASALAAQVNYIVAS